MFLERLGVVCRMAGERSEPHLSSLSPPSRRMRASVLSIDFSGYESAAFFSLILIRFFEPNFGRHGGMATTG